MKIFKSIKWRLQLWYGLMLIVVLAGFGVTAYQLERNRQFRRIDEELHRRVNVLINALHRPPPRGQNPNESLSAPPPAKFRLPPETVSWFDAGDPHDFYFIVRTRNGDEIARSANAPSVEFSPDNRALVEGDAARHRRAENFHPPVVNTFGNYREFFQATPAGETVCVGCRVEAEQREFAVTALELMGVGGIILLIGLAGGGWLVARSLRPIQAISAAALKISAGDLSQRINVEETESELGQLAAILNSTFTRLETAFAQQKQFASDAAHELRTPVTVMLTQTQTALNRERTAEDYKQTVAACQRAAQRMRRLIESLLELARFDAGQEVLKRQPFDLSKTVADCAELVQPLAAARGVKIISKIIPVEITGDAERLAQVVTNLLTNAIQFNRPDGEVRVTLDLQNGLVVLTVADTGQGIPPANLPRVFERFYRADPSRTGGGHAGLGLSICQAIVTAQGGMIEVASELGTGTIFTLRLPTS